MTRDGWYRPAAPPPASDGVSWELWNVLAEERPWSEDLFHMDKTDIPFLRGFATGTSDSDLKAEALNIISNIEKYGVLEFYKE